MNALILKVKTKVYTIYKQIYKSKVFLSYFQKAIEIF